jgi:hypothetical protein
VVELKLFLIETIHCLHILHALLENLHFFLKLDFLLCLIIGIFRS